MFSFARLALLLLGCTLCTSLCAQPVFTSASFQHLVRPHTRTSAGVGNPDTLTGLTHLRGGPHAFDLTGVQWGPGTVEENTAVTCGDALPGCGDVYLGQAASVLRTRQEGRELYRFQDLTEQGLYERGAAGATDDEAGIPIEGLLAFDTPDRVLAFPLGLGSAWTSRAATRLQATEVLSMSSLTDCTREVVAWGTFRVPGHEAEGLLAHEHCTTTRSLGGQLLRDSSEAFRFFSPTLWAMLEVDREGHVRSASVDVFDAVATRVDSAPPPAGLTLHAALALGQRPGTPVAHMVVG